MTHLSHCKTIIGGSLLIGIILVARFNGIVFASEHQHGMMQKSDSKSVPGAPYTLSTCPVSGQRLGSMGDPVIYNHNGTEVRFCCAGCVEQFNQNPVPYLEKIKEETIKDQLPFYPSDTCFVTGQKLTAMGKPINHIYHNRLIRFCCDNCVSQFNINPSQFMQQLDSAVIANQKDNYPFEICVVSGKKLNGSMGEPLDKVIANRLVRLCCPACDKMLQRNPGECLSKLSMTANQRPMMKEPHNDHSGHQHNH